MVLRGGRGSTAGDKLPCVLCGAPSLAAREKGVGWASVILEWQAGGLGGRRRGRARVGKKGAAFRVGEEEIKYLLKQVLGTLLRASC